MNTLNDTIKAFSTVTKDKVVLGLIQCIREWKNDDKTVLDLNETVERYLGNTWIENDDDYNKIYALWTLFRNESIKEIGGMTMNERLHIFGLHDRFEKTKDSTDEDIIYSKLLAKK